MRTSERLVAYAGTPPSPLPADVEARTKLLLLDGLAHALDARDTAFVRGLVGALGHPGPAGAPATLWWAGERATPDDAAFVNGSALRYFDQTDTYLGADVCHFQDANGTVFAAAEVVGASGRQLLQALVVAYEVMAWAAERYAVQSTGPLDQSVYLSIAAPLAVARLWDLSGEQAEHALCIAVASGLALLETRKGDLPSWKACQVPNAGRNALFAARMAEAGVTGPLRVFEGDFGLERLLDGGTARAVALGGVDGTPYRTLAGHLKNYPANYFAQPAIEAAVACRTALALTDPTQVTSVDVSTFRRALDEIDASKWAPTTRETADHSTPYAVAVALVFGRVEHGHFGEECRADQRIAHVLEVMEVKEDGEATELYPDQVRATVTVTTATGATAREEVDLPLGHAANPLPWEEVADRFLEHAGGVVGRRRAERVVELVANLDDVADVRELAAVIGG